MKTNFYKNMFGKGVNYHSKFYNNNIGGIFTNDMVRFSWPYRELFCK